MVPDRHGPPPRCRAVPLAHSIALRKAAVRIPPDFSSRESGARASAENCAHEARVAIGQIAQTTVGTAREVGAEQIVMGSRGMSALPSHVLGSNTNKVIHLAQVPVTIAK